jgi:crotonobetainyl-CoA:carnitine CoA-transferase CaiB-like acyl-CoA transferase
MSGALDGIRVLDLTRYIPGPYCTMLLGDLGADVIKVEEPPLGDPTRILPPAVGEESAAHACLNRNKRSIVVDLRRDEGVEVVRRMARDADVFVEAFRPGALSKRGLGAEALRAANPGLVYCSVSGYGQDGPLASRAGHDVNYAALGGFLGTNTGADGRPVLPLAQVADMAGALVATLGILAALHARERTGYGQTVDASMLQGVLALLTMPAARSLAGDARADELTGTHASYNTYRCRDGGYLAVGALEPRFWKGLCEALGRPDLARRQWKPDAQAEMVAALCAIFVTRDRDEWARDLAGKDVCVEPVLDLEEALATPQAAGFLLDQPSAGAVLRTVAPPLRLGGTPVTVRRQAPALGQHSEEVLIEAGYAPEDVKALRESGVVA